MAGRRREKAKRYSQQNSEWTYSDWWNDHDHSFLLGFGTFYFKTIDCHLSLLLLLLTLFSSLLFFILGFVDFLDINDSRQSQADLLAKILTLLHSLLDCSLLRIHFLQWQPIESLQGQLRILEEGIHQITDVLGVEDLHSGRMGDDKGCIGVSILENVAYLRTIWYCGSISNLPTYILTKNYLHSLLTISLALLGILLAITIRQSSHLTSHLPRSRNGIDQTSRLSLYFQLYLNQIFLLFVLMLNEIDQSCDLFLLGLSHNCY